MLAKISKILKKEVEESFKKKNRRTKNRVTGSRFTLDAEK